MSIRTRKNINQRSSRPDTGHLALLLLAVVVVVGSCLAANAQVRSAARGAGRPERTCNLSITSLAIIRRATGNFTFRFGTTCAAMATVSFGEQPPILSATPHFAAAVSPANGILIPGYSDGLQGNQTQHSIDANLSEFPRVDYYIVTAIPPSGANVYLTGRLSRDSVPDVTTTPGGGLPAGPVIPPPSTKRRPPPPAGPAVFELRCRGGAGLSFAVTDGRSLPTGETMMNMAINFITGTRAVSGDGTNLQPGQCSWLDRGFRPGEPGRMKLEIIYFAQLREEQHGDPVDTSSTAAEHFPDAQNVPRYLNTPNHFWSFFVYNTNEGFFLVTGHQYWRPLDIYTKPVPIDPNRQRPNR